jgi:hypothetical protein
MVDCCWKEGGLLGSALSAWKTTMLSSILAGFRELGGILTGICARVLFSQDLANKELGCRLKCGLVPILTNCRS